MYSFLISHDENSHIDLLRSIFLLTKYCSIAINIAIQNSNPKPQNMKNLPAYKAPGDACNRKVVRGSVDPGVSGRFCMGGKVHYAF